MREVTRGTEVDKSTIDGPSESECSNCSGGLQTNPNTGETYCPDCGLVIHEDAIDYGPEWRSFSDEGTDPSRVGSPATEMLHDRGLSTVIGWSDRDANGRTLDAKKRRKLSRLRTWDERFRARDEADRNLRHALGEIDRMASALGLPDPLRETASAIYRRALNEGLLPGRSIEGVASVAIYSAARIEGVARSLNEVTNVSRVDRLEIERTYRYLQRELELHIEPTSPTEYLPRLASAVECDDKTERTARRLLNAAIEAGVHSGRDPVGIAASGLYAAGILTNAELRQVDIAEAADISTVTIRNRYQEILAVTDDPDSEVSLKN